MTTIDLSKLHAWFHRRGPALEGVPPIHVDPPGTEYVTLAEAVQAAEAYANSFGHPGREKAGWIIRNGENFSFTELVVDGTASMRIDLVAGILSSYPGSEGVLPFHTHPSGSSFSRADYLLLAPSALRHLANPLMGGPYGSTTVAGLSGTSPQGQLVFGDDRSIRFVRPAGEGGFAPWVYNLRLAGGKGRPVAPPISTGRPTATGGSEASGPTPEMRSSSDDGRERGAKPTESATPTTTPTPEAPPSGPSKPPEGGSSIASTVVSVEPTAGGGSKTVEVLRTSSGATSTKTTWRDADGKVVAVSDGPGPDQASGSEGEAEPTGGGGGGDGEGESVDHINSGEGNPGGMTDPDSPGASEGSPRRIQLPIVPSLADKFSRAMMELARASAGGGRTRTPWGGPTDGPSWTPFGPALAYGDPSEGGGGSGNGGSGDGWGEGPLFEGESAVPRRLPTPLERLRAGMNFGRWNTMPGDPPPVDLRTARMHTVDDDGPSAAINTSAHEMYLQRFVNPVARVATRRRG